MRFESPSGAATNQIAVSPFSAEDQPFLTRVARRSHPGQTVSPRDPEALDRFFSNLQRGKLLTEPGAQAFVATIDGEPCGLVALHPDKDYFTSHPRAHSTFLSSREAEGNGVGRALMDHVEGWARDRAFREVVVDVFADNQGAIAFHQRQGYRPAHVRMAKPLTEPRL